MIPYAEMDKGQLKEALGQLKQEYQQACAMGLKLNMARGKPSPSQLDLSMPLLDHPSSRDTFTDENGMDERNYGVLDGLPAAKKLYADILGCAPEEVVVGGNSSLNMMYDTLTRAMLFGFADSPRPWKDEGTIKCLCPVPGYDRHFGISELLGIEMINIPMHKDGPDMDQIEALVKEDASIKFMWSIPMYSNPTGITYSDETVKRLAAMKTAAPDFKIIWDNAYCVHHLTDTPDHLLNLMEECRRAGNPERALVFASMSKVTFSGSAIAAMAASVHNLETMKKQISVQTIGSDKMNQLRHLHFLPDLDAVRAHMKKHRALLEPKFELVDRKLAVLRTLGLAEWVKPNGGYFVSVDVPEGCARRVVGLLKDAGVVMTDAGATFPYGKDPADRNIRIAPTYPELEELEKAMDLFVLCTKIAGIEQLV